MPTKKKPLSNLYKETSAAKKRWETLHEKFINNVTEENAKELSLAEAQEVILDIMRDGRNFQHQTLTHVIKACPKAIPRYLYEKSLAPYKFWSTLAILIEHGDEDNAKSLLNFGTHVIPDGCDYDGVSKVVEFALDKLGFKWFSFFRAVLHNAEHSTVMKYLEARRLDQHSGDTLDFSEVEELRERLLSNRGFYRNEHREIIMAVPEISTRKFWDKWLECYHTEKDINLINEVGGSVAIDALHERMQRSTSVFEIRAYLKAFPKIDQEPFIERIAETFAPDPKKIAREFLDGTMEYHRGWPMIMCGFGR